MTLKNSCKLFLKMLKNKMKKNKSEERKRNIEANGRRCSIIYAEDFTIYEDLPDQNSYSLIQEDKKSPKNFICDFDRFLDDIDLQEENIFASIEFRQTYAYNQDDSDSNYEYIEHI